jgi:hypothetical protein
MKQLISKCDWLGPGSGRLRSNKATRTNPRACQPYVGESPSTQVARPGDLAVGHLLSHVKQEPTVRFFDPTHQSAELAQEASLFSGTAPNDIVSAFALWKVGECGRLFSVIEELVKWDFESAGHLFQCFNGWNSVAIFHARNVAA